MANLMTKILTATCCLAAFNLAMKEGIPASGYHINLTDSLPRGIYRDTQQPITYGVLVAECLPQEWAELAVKRGWLGPGACANGTTPILKKVVAMPGDRVDLTNAYVAVNGKVLLLTASLLLDSQGREIPRVKRGTYILKEDEYWLIADNIVNSLDSRYMGPAKRKDIVTTAEPVWVEAANNE